MNRKRIDETKDECILQSINENNAGVAWKWLENELDELEFEIPQENEDKELEVTPADSFEDTPLPETINVDWISLDFVTAIIVWLCFLNLEKKKKTDNGEEFYS